MAYDYHARNEESGLRLGGLALVSLLLHLLVVPWVVARAVPEDIPSLPEVREIDPIELVAVREPEQQRPDAEQVQYVSLPEPPPDEERLPEEARFADQFDRAVDRETVSREDTGRPGAATTGETQPTPAEQMQEQVAAAAATTPPEQPPTDETPREQRDRRRDRRSDRTDAAETAAEDQVVVPHDGTADGEMLLPLRQGVGTTGRGDPSVDLGEFFRHPVGRPEPEGGRRNDFLELEEGDRTALNSYRSMYWSFFHRMQEALSREWEPNRVLRRNDPTGLLHGNRDRYTVLSVTLNGDGTLRHTRVVRSSDLDFLDQEAIRAFQAAAPFHNVPEGLKDHNGHVTFQFGFHVSFSNSRNRIRRLDGY